MSSPGREMEPNAKLSPPEDTALNRSLQVFSGEITRNSVQHSGMLSTQPSPTDSAPATDNMVEKLSRKERRERFWHRTQKKIRQKQSSQKAASFAEDMHRASSPTSDTTYIGEIEPLEELKSVGVRSLAPTQSHDAEYNEPIFSLACDCDELFKSCTGQIQDHKSTAYNSIEQYKSRFDAWSAYSGVFAERKINLDRRLRNKPRIQDIVVRLLLNLRRSLAQLNGHLTASIDGVWIHSNPATSSPELSKEQRSMPITHDSEAIDEALQALSHVSVAIRQSCRVTETGQARRLLSGRPEVPQYEFSCYVALETLYFSAPEALLRQICESMVSRYARHLYRAPVQEALERDVRKQTANIPVPLPPVRGQDLGHDEAAQEQFKSPFPRQVFLLPPETLPSIKSSQFSQNLKAAQSRIFPSPTLVKFGRIYGPPVPTFDATGQARCEWCFRKINRTMVQEIPSGTTEKLRWGWSSQGIDHYEKDLEPFPCISELCAEKAPSFCSRTDWSGHMLKHHANWPQYIHRKRMWKCELGLLDPGEHRTGPVQECPGCQSDYIHESAAYFSSAGHFMNHVRTIHIGHRNPDWSKSDLLALADESIVDSSLDAFICPICYLAPEGLQPSGSNSMQNHIADHLQVLMLLSLRLMQDPAQNAHNPDDGGSSSGAIADASQSSIDGVDADHEQNLAGLPSPPSKSPIIRPSSPALSDVAADERASWDDITKKIREAHPIHESQMDQHLSRLDEERGRSQSNTSHMDAVNAIFSDLSSSSEEGLDDAVAGKLYLAFTPSTFDERKRDFLPHGLLAELVTPQAVEEELRRSERELTESENNKFDRHYQQQLSVWISATAPALFATIAQCGVRPREMLLSMANFQRNGFDDSRLPLEDPRTTSPPSELFHNKIWKPWALSEFHEKQWRFLVPVFSSKQFHYDLAAHAILPFTGDMRDVVHGGFSSVRKVEIHPNHCTGLSILTVALKEIRTTHGSDRSEIDSAWEHEARTLRLVNKLNHAHIIACIAAIRRGDRRYFMFPWADGGTLRELWALTPRQDLRASLVRDCIEQLRGLVDALAQMHNYGSSGAAQQEQPHTKLVLDKNHKQDQEADISAPSIRHGDLKPENILRFSYQGSDIGLLKIADLAIAKQHIVATQERSQATATRYGTIHYEAPETVTARYGRSRLYDIWSMGCITFEFIIWLLYGNDELHAFYEELREDTPETFQFYEVSEFTGKPIVSVHKIVLQWMNYIENSDPECIQRSAIRDLLSIVRDKLLVVDLPPNRSTNVQIDTEAHLSSISILPPDLSTPNTSIPHHRVTAVEFRDALDELLANANELEYFLVNPDRAYVKPPSTEGYRLAKSQLLVPSAHNRSMELIVRPSRPDYANAPLRHRDYVVDNIFAEKVIDSLGLQAFLPTVASPSQLCDVCVSLDFWSAGFTYEWSYSDLTDRARTCSFCRIIVMNHVRKDVDKSWLERSGSNLAIADSGTPFLTILRSPKLKTPIEIQLGFPELPKPGSEIFFGLLRLWLADCDTNHQGCHGVHYERLPTRLIDVGLSSTPKLRLVETHEENILSREFVALSYLWGKTSPFLTTTEKLEDFKKSIPYANLPATLRDAVECTRGLGIRYLWVDALCIVHDSHDDKNKEVLRMEEVFGGAYCVLAASRSLSQTSGFLGPRTPREYVTFQRGNEEPFYICDIIDGFDRDVRDGPLNRRGWVLQEQALARRIIHFGETQTYFECSQSIRCETLIKMRNQMAGFFGNERFLMTASPAKKISYIQDLYRHYSKLHLTYPKDRPVAIGGVERRLIQDLEIKGGYGIMDDGDKQEVPYLFFRTLLWQRDEKNGAYLKPISDIGVPSWSWMAYEGSIDYLSPPFGGAEWQTEEIRPPWTHGGHNPEQELNDPSLLLAIITSFDLRGDIAETKLVYDTFVDPRPDTMLECVVLARSKNVTNKKRGERRCYVLLVVRTQEKRQFSVSLEAERTFLHSEYSLRPTESISETLYRRIGVGYMPQRMINFKRPIIRARIS